MGADIPCKWDRSTPGGSIPVEHEWENFLPDKHKELNAKQNICIVRWGGIYCLILKVSSDIIKTTSSISLSCSKHKISLKENMHEEEKNSGLPACSRGRCCGWTPCAIILWTSPGCSWWAGRTSGTWGTRGTWWTGRRKGPPGTGEAIVGVFLPADLGL